MTGDWTRLQLEEECAGAFNVLRGTRELRGKDLTLIFFDYGERGNVAYKTSLTVGGLADSLEILVESWTSGRARQGVPGFGRVELSKLQKLLQSAVPKGVGCAVLVGRDDRSAYVGTGAREDIIRMFQNELIPNFRKEEAMFVDPVGKKALIQQEKESVIVDKIHAAVAHLPKEDAREALQEALGAAERADLAKSLVTRSSANSTDSALAWRGGVPMPERLLGKLTHHKNQDGQELERVTSALARGGLEDALFEPVPDPEDPDLSPGEALAARMAPEVEANIRASSGRPLEERRRLLMKFLVDELDARGIDPTAGERRYVMTVWSESIQTIDSVQRAGKMRAHDTMQRLGQIAKMKAAAVEVMPEAPQFIEELRKRIKQCVWPPNRATPLNVEAEMMAFAYCVLVIPNYWGFQSDKQPYQDEQLKKFGYYLAAENQLEPFGSNFIQRHKEAVGIGFALEWLKSNFAKLEVSHKMAAALCLTDVPDEIEVASPWHAWSLVLPDGLLSATVDGKEIVLARALCIGVQVHYVIDSHGVIFLPDKEAGIGSPPEWQALSNLVLGVCIAIGEPAEHVKKQTSGHSKSNRKGGAPDLTQVRFMLSAPIEIDLRDDLKRFLRGERKRASGGHISVQFLVRGHWKNQVHGPGRSLRKRIWIKPFWKGDEEARVLLRNYEIKGEEPQA